MYKIDEYIVMTKVIYQGNIDDYLDAARELADSKQMPVLFVWYNRPYFILPEEAQAALASIKE